MVKSTSKMIVQETEITFIYKGIGEFISLTDIAKYRNSKEPFSIINNWMRSRSTIEFLGLWEKLNNPDFKPIEFERFRNEAGSNYFVYHLKDGLKALTQQELYLNREDMEELLLILILHLSLLLGFHQSLNCI